MFDAFMGEILQDLIEHRKDGIMFGSWKLVEDVPIESIGDVLAEYKINSKTSAANQAIKFLTGYGNKNALKLSPVEQQNLLQDYLLNFYNVERYGGRCNLDNSQASIAAGAGYSKIETSMFSGSLETCYIRPTKSTGLSVNGFNSQGYFDGTPMSYEDVIKALGGSVDDMLSGDKAKCNNAANNALNSANSIVDQYYYGNVSKEAHDRALATIESINKVKQDHGEYWYEENGTIMCYAFTGLDGSTVETPTDSPNLPSDNPSGGDSSGDNAGEETPTCYNAAGSLGWILCPVLDGLGSVVNGIYDNVIVPQFLEIENTLMSTSGGGSIYKGWQDFRNFANIIFVILFVIVILAQITGIGISNYNIKKILPRLVMIVALVNISFILCQLAVDVSNILGFQLKDMFVKMAGDTTVTVGGFVGNIVPALVSTAVTGGIAIGAGIVLAGTWEFWLFPLLLFLLGVVVSIFFFAIILGVRKAGILILIVLAPVAVVCYALPNTKKFFDRWLKLFSSLILVYPICGLLMGGGQYASTLLLGAAGGDDVGFFMALVAMLVQVVPFFFIPSLVRGSLSAMGNLGMKISNMGSRVGGGLRGAARNSRFVQERQRELARNNNQRRDRRLAGRLSSSAQATNAEVKGYEDRLRSNGIDLGDDRAVRRFLGNDYGAYRSAKNRSAKLNYRSNQARRRYESSIMEDAAAATGASRELLAPGSKRYASYMEGLESAQRVKDAADQQKLFEAGRGTYQDASGATQTVNPGDLRSLEAAHGSLLEQLRDNPEDVETRAKLEAIQDMLAVRGDKGHEAMYSNYERIANASTSDQLQSNGLRYAANHLSKYQPQIKKGSRSFDKLLNQYQAGTVDNYRSSATAAGKTLSEALSTESALGYNSSSFNDMNEDVLKRYTAMAQAGHLDDVQLQHLTKIANEALSNDQIQLKGDVEKELHDFLTAAYGTSAVGHSVKAQGVSTAGSTAMGTASVQSLDRIAQQIQGGQLTGAAATKLVENARRYMESGDLIEADRAQALRKIITSAQAKGVDSMDKLSGVNTSDDFSFNETAFKVRGAKPVAKMPAGWTRNVSGAWMDISTGRPLSATDVKKAEEIEKYNNQRDIENGKYS